jgi:hypothetical protein
MSAVRALARESFFTRSLLDTSLQAELEPTSGRYKLEFPSWTTGISFRADPFWPFGTVTGLQPPLLIWS